MVAITWVKTIMSPAVYDAVPGGAPAFAVSFFWRCTCVETVEALTILRPTVRKLHAPPASAVAVTCAIAKHVLKTAEVVFGSVWPLRVAVFGSPPSLAGNPPKFVEHGIARPLARLQRSPKFW